MENVLLLMHPVTGGLATLAALWIFVDALNATESGVVRIKNLSIICAVLMWLTYILGGYFYVVYYGVDKGFIKEGPWAFGHNFFMEVKEHAFLMLLLLSTYLPIVAHGYLPSHTNIRKIVLWVTGLIVPTSLAMEGSGAILSVAAKVALLLKAKGM